MTHRPYTDEDLRAQATLYMDEAGVNPLVVLFDMADETPWCGLGTDDFNDAHATIMEMIHGGGVLPEEVP